MKFFAKLISWLFLPLLTPLYALLVVMYTPSVDIDILQINSLSSHSPKTKIAILLIFTFYCFLVPAIVIMIYRMLGLLTSVMMENKKERRQPAIVTFICGLGLLYSLYTQLPVPFSGYYLLFGLAIGCTVTVLVCAVITFWYKISLHAGGMGILCGFLIAYYSQCKLFDITPIALAFLLSGVVMSMRMYLGAHDLRQSLYGYASGFFLTYFSCIGLLGYYGV